MGKIRDFSQSKEFALLSAINTHELSCYKESPRIFNYSGVNYPGVNNYQNLLIGINTLTQTKVKEIFSNVRAVESRNLAVFRENYGAVECFNIILKELYNTIRDPSNLSFNAQETLGCAGNRYANQEFSRMRPGGGEIDWEYVHSVQHYSTNSGKMLTSSRVFALNLLLLSFTDENGVLDRGSIAEFYSGGYVATTQSGELPKDIPRIYDAERNMPEEDYYKETRYEFSPMTLLATSMYRASSYALFIGPYGHLAFTGGRTPEEKDLANVVRAQIEQRQLMSLIETNGSYLVRVTSDKPINSAGDLGSVPKISVTSVLRKNPILRIEKGEVLTGEVKEYVVYPWDPDSSQEYRNERYTDFSADMSSNINGLKREQIDILDETHDLWKWRMADMGVAGIGEIVPGVGLVYTFVRQQVDYDNAKQEAVDLYLEIFEHNYHIDQSIWDLTQELQQIDTDVDVYEAFSYGSTIIKYPDGSLRVGTPYVNRTELEINARAYGTTGTDLLNADDSAVKGYVEWYGDSNRPVQVSEFRRKLSDALADNPQKFPEGITTIDDLSPEQIIELDNMANEGNY